LPKRRGRFFWGGESWGRDFVKAGGGSGGLRRTGWGVPEGEEREEAATRLLQGLTAKLEKGGAVGGLRKKET